MAIAKRNWSKEEEKLIPEIWIEIPNKEISEMTVPMTSFGTRLKPHNILVVPVVLTGISLKRELRFKSYGRMK